jgi:hypothetical protein
MRLLPQLLREYGWIIYIASALGFIYFIIVGINSLRDLSRAVFGLERSTVSARASSAWLRAMLCAALAALVYFGTSWLGAPTAARQITRIINVTRTPVAGIVFVPTSVPTADFLPPTPAITPTFVIQSAPTTTPLLVGAEATAVLETPTPIDLPTLTPEPSPTLPPPPTLPAVTLAPTTIIIAALPTAAPVATATPRSSSTTAPAAASAATTTTGTLGQLPTVVVPTRRPLPTATTAPTAFVQPTSEPIPAADCADPYTMGIISPQNGQQVAGQISVAGNAGFDPNGGYAKLEVLLPEGWGFLNRIDVPTKEGPLGVLNVSVLGVGWHKIRVIAIDKSQRENKYCLINIRVVG